MPAVAERKKSYEELESELAAAHAEISAAREENERLWQQIRLLRKYVFGRKSEKLPQEDIRQTQLFSSELTLIEPTEKEIPVQEHVRKGGGRKALPKELPHERIEYEPEEQDCSCCGAKLEKIGEEVTTELDYVPARFVVREHVKIKRACKRCKGNGVKIGRLPLEVQPIERGRAGAGLITHIAVSKYCDHLPLNRLEQMFAREGVNIARQRMCDWLGEIARLLKPVISLILTELLKRDYLQADETTIKVQVDDSKERLHTGYFWAIHAPPNIVYYHYAPSRAGDVPKDLLKDFNGTLQTDAYAAYNPVMVPDKCRRLACLAHIRRKLLEANASASKLGDQALKLIAAVYQVERQARETKIDDEELLLKRQELRQQKSLPLLERLFTVLDEIEQTYLPKNVLRQAAAYALAQKTEMFHFLDDPRFEIDNNAIERLMRPIAVGRKNYLFAGSHAGAQWAATFYTLISNCKLSAVNPVEYLRDTILRINTLPSSRIPELLPYRWSSK